MKGSRTFCSLIVIFVDQILGFDAGYDHSAQRVYTARDAFNAINNGRTTGSSTESISNVDRRLYIRSWYGRVHTTTLQINHVLHLANFGLTHLQSSFCSCAWRMPHSQPPMCTLEASWRAQSTQPVQLKALHLVQRTDQVTPG